MKYKMTKQEKEYLKTYDITKYDRPSVATDIVIFSIMDEEEDDNYRKDVRQKLNVLLINRANYPFKGSWALPGGFCEKTEDVETTAHRELEEETGIRDAFLESFDVFGKKDRDPRGWIISNAFLALVDGDKYKVRAGSDAWEACWFSVDIDKKSVGKKSDVKFPEVVNDYTVKLVKSETELKAVVREKRIFKNYHEQKSYELLECNGLAFDHAIIILKAYLNLQYRAENEPVIVFDLMPDLFTWAHLQNAFEVILGRKLLVANFRRKLAEYVVETDQTVTGVGHRPAKLFCRNIEKFLK